ncbi:Ribosomal RNA large subunit methyltransferase H [Labeo rohita]|uniref:Ribosomal RNA large subunit methyltransferase H n=1 Tax=Labeo rohita TaxID=84645 RepID=A0ABQ8LWJ4_LABRO|nr:Ribosomal RNA large subunit methyltransferase H [Labeo rohita]
MDSSLSLGACVMVDFESDSVALVPLPETQLKEPKHKKGRNDDDDDCEEDLQSPLATTKHHLRFAEDLSPEDRERRNKLWPLVEKARQQGCRAYFVGPKAYIDGKELVLQDMEVTERTEPELVCCFA